MTKENIITARRMSYKCSNEWTKIGKHKMMTVRKEYPAFYILWNIITRYGFDEKKRVQYIIKHGKILLTKVYLW